MEERRQAVEAGIEAIADRIRKDAARHLAAIENYQARTGNLQTYREVLASELNRHEQQFHLEEGEGSLLELARNRKQSLFVGDYIKSQVERQIAKKTEAESEEIESWKANVDPRWAVYSSGHPKRTPYSEIVASARLNLLQETYRLNGKTCPEQHPFMKLMLDYIETDQQLLEKIGDNRSSASNYHIGLSKMENVLSGKLAKGDTLGQLFQKLLHS